MIDWTKSCKEIFAENPGYVFKDEESIRMSEKMEKEHQDYLHDTIEAKIQDGDMQGAADMIALAGNANHAAQLMLLCYADKFSDPVMLFDLIVDVYTSDGYFFPKKLIQLAKRIAPLVPEEHRLNVLPIGDPVTVWRGCSAINPNSGKYMRTEISWTTDKTMAIWFANRISNPNSENGKGGVWEATIPRKKIIAFTQDRNESEVLQHMNVQNPHLLSISAEEWETALQHQLEQREKRK